MKKSILCFLLAAATAAHAADNSDRWPDDQYADAKRQIEEARRAYEAKCAELVKNGASPAQCESFFGKPTSVNRTFAANVIKELWIYNQYSYVGATRWNVAYRQLEKTTLLRFENARLVSITN